MIKVVIPIAAALLLCLVLIAQSAKPHSDNSAMVARGKYLVEGIGMCGDCHTPHTARGEPIKEQWLKGSVLDFKPTIPVPNWADKSVNIAGLPGWNVEDAIKFLMTGNVPNSVPARPPMPQYRYNRQDATAIVAYLKSLAPAK